MRLVTLLLTLVAHACSYSASDGLTHRDTAEQVLPVACAHEEFCGEYVCPPSMLEQVCAQPAGFCDRRSDASQEQVDACTLAIEFLPCGAAYPRECDDVFFGG